MIVTVSESDARINRDTLAGFWITGKGLWQIFIGESLEMSSQRFKFCISLRPYRPGAGQVTGTVTVFDPSVSRPP